MAQTRVPKPVFITGANGFIGLAFVATVARCSLPTVNAYPFYGPYGSRNGVIGEATARSTALEQYVKDWMAGKVSATVPANLVPEATRSNAFTLTRSTPVGRPRGRQ